MNLAWGGFLAVVAVVSTGIAIWAGDSFALAVPAASVAVLAAALLLADAFLGRPRAARLPEGSSEPREVETVRAAFRSGRLGREAIADLLDRLERAGPNPGLPSRRSEETRRLMRMPYADFRNYVRHRLDDLESRS
jgi:hypothetical protein